MLKKTCFFHVGKNHGKSQKKQLHGKYCAYSALTYPWDTPGNAVSEI